jgi:NurA-like 5'-3' nuclease
MDKSLNEKIKVINEYLRTKESKKISNNELRKLIEDSVGSFKVPDRGIGVEKYTKDGILGVDGSISNVGATFPYVLTLIRAYTMNTKADKQGNMEKVEEVFCPVYAQDRITLEDMVAEVDGSITMENAFHRYTKDRMAELELMSAMKGIERFKSKIILMDGGFYRFEITCPTLWKEFKALCLKTGTLAVGVIEEVSTHKISKLLIDDLPANMNKDYDRELLFGALKVGEWLKVNDDIEIKKGYYTSFARFSKHPQVIGVDFLKEQMDEVDTTMDLIASLTPINSRGVPIWIDMVDANVRFTQKETDVLLSSMDIDIREKFIIANHDRRQY